MRHQIHAADWRALSLSARWQHAEWVSGAYADPRTDREHHSELRLCIAFVLYAYGLRYDHDPAQTDLVDIAKPLETLAAWDEFVREPLTAAGHDLDTITSTDPVAIYWHALHTPVPSIEEVVRLAHASVQLADELGTSSPLHFGAD